MTAIHPANPGLSTRPDWSARFEAAQHLAAEAGALARSRQPPPGTARASLKSPQDWLTEADGDVERFLSTRLLHLFPDDGFQGEETGPTRPGRTRWVVDPIDGTSNFARGAPRWCVSIALLHDDQPILGVLDAPALHERWAACQGHPATLNGTPIHTAATPTLDRAIIEAGWSPRTTTPAYLATCHHLLAAGAMLRSGGSGALGLADVAAGRIDGYLEHHINLWDCAAAIAILQAAGATLNTFIPDSLHHGGPIIATTQALFPNLQAALA